MADDILLALKAITADLLFVTSQVAIDTLMPGEDEQSLNGKLGGRLHVIPSDDVPDLYSAADGVRQRLMDESSSSIEGVLILGDYAMVPARTIKFLDFKMLLGLKNKAGQPEPDSDDWWAWNDDIYGNRRGDSFLPDLPVSRLPFAPKIIADPYARPRAESVFGLRASEFGFADAIYKNVLNVAGRMRESPPVSTTLPEKPPSDFHVEHVSGIDFKVDWVYLVLHHLNSAGLQLSGTQITLRVGTGTRSKEHKWRPVAIDGSVFRSMTNVPTLIFGGVCWGCLTVSLMACTHFHDGGGVPEAIEVGDSVPCSFINKGAHSFIGFTTYHNIERTMDVPRRQLDDLLLGAPLHWYFWENIVEGMPPAKALFMAKASVIGAIDSESMDPLALAQTLKAVWSATCLGFGW